MDTSEVYIKMCDWKDVQKNAPTPDGKVIYWPTELVYMDGKGDLFVCVSDTCLFRQDQIQAMLKSKNSYIDGTRWWTSLEELSEFRYDLGEIWKKRRATRVDIKTWEQLWLAFYMYEKHGKVWDGKKWVK